MVCNALPGWAEVAIVIMSPGARDISPPPAAAHAQHMVPLLAGPTSPILDQDDPRFVDIPPTPLLRVPSPDGNLSDEVGLLDEEALGLTNIDFQSSDHSDLDLW